MPQAEHNHSKALSPDSRNWRTARLHFYFFAICICVAVLTVAAIAIFDQHHRVEMRTQTKTRNLVTSVN